MAEADRFATLYQDHVKLVRGLLFNMAGPDSLDDLTQDVFLKLWKALPSFAFRSTVRTWVYRVCMNVAIDHLRQRGRRARHPETPIEETEIAATTIASVNPALTAAIESSLDELGDDERAVVVLYYFEELKVSEVAKILEIPAGTVKTRLFSARAKLATLLEDWGENEHGQRQTASRVSVAS